jgi:hypothetical protein
MVSKQYTFAKNAPTVYIADSECTSSLLTWLRYSQALPFPQRVPESISGNLSRLFSTHAFRAIGTVCNRTGRAAFRLLPFFL